MKVVRSDSPDLVLLDIWMPEMDGLETLKRLRSQFPVFTDRMTVTVIFYLNSHRHSVTF
jgi:CheY-like chemotaxis protein